MNINVKGTVLLYHVTRNKIYEVKEFLREKNAGNSYIFEDTIDFLCGFWNKYGGNP
jgi:hypothetical protein